MCDKMITYSAIYRPYQFSSRYVRLEFSEKLYHCLILRIIVQTHFKVFLNDRELEFDGLQPLSVGFALLIYLNLVDKSLNKLSFSA